MHTAYLASVFFHILAAMAWLGGMIFFVAVIVPLYRGTENLHKVAIRFRTIGWISIATLVVTGVFNVLYRGYGIEHFFNGVVFSGQWGKVLAHKLSLVAVVIALSLAHDLWLGPRASRLAREGADAATREKARKLASVMGRVSFALALAIVALAVVLVRG